jgi:hypothetical protein
VSQRCGDFQTGEGRAQAVVRAVAECERRRPGSVYPKLVGRIEDRNVVSGDRLIDEDAIRSAGVLTYDLLRGRGVTKVLSSLVFHQLPLEVKRAGSAIHAPLSGKNSP